MENKKISYLIIGIFLIGMIGLVSASNYIEQKQNTEFTLSITSNNATSCNLSSIDYSNGTNVIYNLELTQDGRTFYKTLSEGNYSSLGDICHNLVCTDGVTIETGSVCRTIKNSNITFFIILLSLAALFFIASLFVNEEFFVYISGVLFLIAGVYTMINGIDIVNDWYSRAISYVCIGLGFLFTLGAYIYNSYSKYGDYDDD